jgi:hypothetical protein
MKEESRINQQKSTNVEKLHAYSTYTITQSQHQIISF